MGVLSPARTGPGVSPRLSGRTLAARLDDILFVAALLLVMVVFLFPVVYMMISAFKPGSLAMAYPSVWVFEPSLEHFERVLRQQHLAIQLWNSLLVAVGAVVLGLVLGLPAAYSIARYRQSRLATWLLVVRMVPYFGALIPMYVIFRQVGLTNTILGLTLSHLVITVPLTTWIMIGFIEDIPRELEEAALIDGASRLRTFAYVALPLVTPGMVAAAVLNFIFSWNNFQMALILGGNETKTAPVAVLQYIGSEAMDWGGMMAAATVVSVPTFLFVLLVQKYLVQGLTTGGLKG
jgi:multiple sugar transport system permease protein